MCLSIIMALSLPASLLAGSAKDIDKLAEQIRKTDEQLEALRQKIDRNNTLKQDLQAAFQSAREKRGERDQRLDELDGRIKQFNKQLGELEAAIDTASSTIGKRKSELAASLRSSQRVGEGSGLKTLLQHDNPAQAQRLDVYRDYFFQAQQARVHRAINYLDSVEQAHLAALKDRNWLDHIKRKAAGQRESYAQDADEKRQQIVIVDGELQQSTRTVAQLQKDQLRLQSLLEELETMQRGGSGYFASLQGQYELPVSGEITARFGDLKSVGKLRWDGLFIKAREGVLVNAVADGEMVYSDWLQGFGMLAIIDHGDGYMTLYGGNRTVTAGKGDWVESGSTIATVGDSGGQNTSGLYFEIRHNATALDPQDWLKPASS